jgi:hypothetical protein
MGAACQIHIRLEYRWVCGVTIVVRARLYYILENHLSKHTYIGDLGVVQYCAYCLDHWACSQVGA